MRRLTNVLFLALISSSLTSCFVSSDSGKTYELVQPTFQHVYLDNEYIRYNFTGDRIIGGSTGSGALETVWKIAGNVNDPLNPGTLLPPFTTALSTLSIAGEEDISSIQYLTQSQSTDSTDYGSIFLHAFDGQPPGFWIDTNNDPSNLEKVQTLWSPFQDDSQGIDVIGQQRSVSFTIMSGCTPPRCTNANVAQYSETYKVTGITTNPISTLLGDFNAYQVDYNGTITASNITLAALVDIRAACAIHSTATQVTFSGSAYIYPTIGPIMIDNHCNSGGATFNTRSYISATNISF